MALLHNGGMQKTEAEDLAPGETGELRTTGDAKCGIAVSALYQLERLGLMLDHARLCKPYRHIPGGWWVQEKDEVEGPYTFGAVVRLLVDGHSPIHVVHESTAGEEPVPWKRLSYSPMWMERTKVFFWSAGLLALISLLCFATLQTISPNALRFPASAIYWIIVAGVAGRQLLRWRKLAPQEAESDALTADAIDTDLDERNEIVAEVSLSDMADTNMPSEGFPNAL